MLLPGAATSLSVSPDSGSVIVAGRDMLRLVSVNENHLADVLNLLTHTRKSSNLSSNNVKWRPQHASQLATGATTGAILIWDTAKRGDSLVRTLSGHSRAVNSLSFLEREPNLLLSASQDKTGTLGSASQRSSSASRWQRKCVTSNSAVVRRCGLLSPSKMGRCKCTTCAQTRR
jgi:WD repeat-containing protein 24